MLSFTLTPLLEGLECLHTQLLWQRRSEQWLT